MGLGGIERVKEVDHTTVITWLTAPHEQSAELGNVKALNPFVDSLSPMA